MGSGAHVLVRVDGCWFRGQVLSRILARDDGRLRFVVRVSRGSRSYVIVVDADDCRPPTDPPAGRYAGG